MAAMAETKNELDALGASVLGDDGHLPSDTRRAVEALSAELGGGPAGEGVPDDLAAFVEKVALHAYKTTDADIEKLKEAGYSEDAIFELIVSAAVGAGRARYERGMAALRGDA
jgi:alkylhydroperoxidase family enzyme